jgi:hypothetical protein
MRKLVIILLLLVFVVAYFTKPDDKTCIIGAVKAVWGDVTPNPYDKPAMFESFMNLQSRNVQVADWVFLKRVKYVIPGYQKTVALGAFRNVFPLVKPLQLNEYIPKMPVQRR